MSFLKENVRNAGGFEKNSNNRGIRLKQVSDK